MVWNTAKNPVFIFTVVWLNKSHTLCITLARLIAATAKLGSLAIKTWDCEFMTSNQFPESESMRPVLGSLNLQVNRKIHQNDVNILTRLYQEN